MCLVSTSQFPRSADADVRATTVFVYGFSGQKWRDTQSKHMFRKHYLHCTLNSFVYENKIHSTIRNKKNKQQKTLDKQHQCEASKGH